MMMNIGMVYDTPHLTIMIVIVAIARRTSTLNMTPHPTPIIVCEKT